MYENYFSRLSALPAPPAPNSFGYLNLDAALQRAGLPPDSEIRGGPLPNWGPSGYTDELDAPTNDDEFFDYPEEASLSAAPDRIVATLVGGDLYIYNPCEGDFLLWNY